MCLVEQLELLGYLLELPVCLLELFVCELTCQLQLVGCFLVILSVAASAHVPSHPWNFQKGSISLEFECDSYFD